MKTFLSWSGGKDSSASIVLAYEKGIHLDGVVFSEVMFDNSRNISGENPKHIKWVYETAIPIIEKMGYPVNVVRAKEDYLSLFNHRISSSKVAERNGKKAGWLLGGMCAANSRLKVRPIIDFFKNVGDYRQFIGIAVDEPKRLKRLKPNSRSLLAENGIAENDTYKICREYGLLSPNYESRCRGGCWFCPNCTLKDFALLKKQYPELWAELEKLSHDKEVVSDSVFKYGRTFASVNRDIDLINNQITIFDYLQTE